MKKSLLIAVALFGVIMATALPASAQVVVQFGGRQFGGVVVVPAPVPVNVCYGDYGDPYNCGPVVTYPYPYDYYSSYGYWNNGYWIRRDYREYRAVPRYDYRGGYGVQRGNFGGYGGYAHGGGYGHGGRR